MPTDSKEKKPTSVSGRLGKKLSSLGTSRRKQLEQDLARVNQQIYSRNLELAQTNKTLALLQSIDSLVLREQESVRPLSALLTRMIVTATDYPLVGIMGYQTRDKEQLGIYGLATAAALPASSEALVNRFRVPANSRWLQRDEPLRFVKLTAKTDARVAALCGCTQEEIHSLRDTLGLSSACLIKLRARDHLVGVMLVGSEEDRHDLTAFEQTLFLRLSEAVGIAIDHKLLLEENQRVLQELETTNEKLRVLDRAKDDFISMASHQLRTPLTSVKGYLSMVLEGDAGTLNAMQRQLLEEAFASSQRMVYLIGDFLNVSRLQTGKFVLERSPTDLSKLVADEVEQLRPTATARRMTLEYQRPDTFPSCNLDQNKIRQVIMNFIDNAIFYSHEGATIKVELLQAPGEAVLQIKDTGIGIPKDEQHHLFTKFYRASNAKRVRPDGTGIGIFMAKKVVVAHGGSIIFESVENKGSTFGFRLPLAQPKN